MQLISTINPEDVLNKYIEMYEDKCRWTSKDKVHFNNAFGVWLTRLFQGATHSHPEKMELSLSRTNYVGKKTRALLVVMGIQEPKTLGELKQQFIDFHSKHR